MDYTRRDALISRVCAGYVYLHTDDGRIKVRGPSYSLLYDAVELYSDVLNEVQDVCLNDDEIFFNLINYGLWSHDLQEELDLLPERIKENKHRLFKAIDSPSQEKLIRYEIEQQYRRLSFLNSKRTMWDYVTASGVASYCKWAYILQNCIADSDGLNLIKLLGQYQSQSISETQMRELARNDPWTSLWTIKKKNGQVFPEPITPEQKTLMSWSILYDNVYESVDCPHSSVIDDDWMLDGWLVDQSKKREEDQKKKANSARPINSKIANADEVLIVAKSIEDIQRIYDMNSPRARMIVKERLGQVKNQGEVNYKAFADVKNRNRTRATNLLQSKMRKR